MTHNIRRMYQKVKRAWHDRDKTSAQSPRHYSMKDWKNVLLAVRDDLANKRISILAGGIAYFLTFAIFPALAATVGILSFIIPQSQIDLRMTQLEKYLPTSIASLVSTQLQSSLAHPQSSLLIVIFGILIALFSVAGAISNVINATNAIYEVKEKRSFIRLRLLSGLFMFGAAFLLTLVASLLALNGHILTIFHTPGWVINSILSLRWLLIAFLFAGALSLFYRYGPSRNNPYWRWVNWGSSIASIIWLIGTSLFFIYVRYFAHYTQSYSIFAGIIILMTWLNLTAMIVLLGAEINFRLESQTHAQTTKPSRLT